MPIDESTCKRLSIELLQNGSCRDLYIVSSLNPTVQDYLNELKQNDKSRYDGLLARIKRVSDRPRCSDDLLKKLEGSKNIYEIRSPNDRILCFFEGNDLIMTHGFKKSGQKTPSKQIKKAEKIKETYLTSKLEKSHANKKVDRD